MKRRSPYARPGILSLPAVLVIAFWAGLWLVWPREVHSDSRRHRSGTGVAYLGHMSRDAEICRAALQFVDPATPALRVPGEDLERAMRVRSDWQADYLEKEPRWEGALAIEQPVAGGDAAAERAQYQPPWPQQPTFSETGDAETRLMVEVTGDLQARGFQVPAVSTQSLRLSDKPWQATLVVQCDADGRATDVFLENRSDNATVNAALVRALYAGHLLQPGTSCAGRVTFSYGRE